MVGLSCWIGRTRSLQTLRINEDGVRKDLDSEFLHDFRVAVRRTRSALSQIKGVFPAAVPPANGAMCTQAAEPAEHHQPRDWDTLLAHNELELYDTMQDPEECNNLANDARRRRAGADS